MRSRYTYYSEDDEYRRFESYDDNDVLRSETTITEDSVSVVEYDENGDVVNRMEMNTGDS